MNASLHIQDEERPSIERVAARDWWAARLRDAPPDRLAMLAGDMVAGLEHIAAVCGVLQVAQRSEDVIGDHRLVLTGAQRESLQEGVQLLAELLHAQAARLEEEAETARREAQDLTSTLAETRKTRARPSPSFPVAQPGGDLQ